jgi:hypothetical protein
MVIALDLQRERNTLRISDHFKRSTLQRFGRLDGGYRHRLFDRHTSWRKPP